MHSNLTNYSGDHFGVLQPEGDLDLTKVQRCTLETEGPPGVHVSLELLIKPRSYVLRLLRPNVFCACLPM
jgi:hypothetical protein